MIRHDLSEVDKDFFIGLLMRRGTKAFLFLLLLVRSGSCEEEKPMKRVLRTTHVCAPLRFVLALLTTLLFAVQCFTQTRSASSNPQNERGVLLEQLLGA